MLEVAPTKKLRERSVVAAATPAAPEPKKIMVTDAGLVLLPNGRHRKITKSLQTLLAKSKDNQRQEDLRFYRTYLEHVGEDPNGPLTFLFDSYNDGVLRIRRALEAVGLTVTLQTNLTDNYDVELKTGHPNYMGRYTRRIRVLYAQLIEDRLRTDRANPAEIVNWWKKDAGERLQIANATISNPFGKEYAGARFIVKGRQKHEGREQNPQGVCDSMLEAVLRAEDMPENVKMLTQVYRDEAPRVSSLLQATGFGWSKSDFGPKVFVRVKFGGTDPDFPVTLIGDVHEWLLDNFSSRPHPSEPGRSMMDHMRQLAKTGDTAALDAIDLFPSEKTGKALGRSGLRYWLRDALLTAGVMVDGWTPVPHFFRNGRMDAEVREIFRTTHPKSAERKDRLAAAAREFGHESVAWKKYVQAAIKAETARIRRLQAEERRARWRAQRDGTPLPPRLPHLADPTAAAMHAGLPRMPLQ